MSKMNELSMIVDQIRELSEKLSRLSDEITELFTAQEDTQESTPATIEEPKITLEDVRAVLARKTRVSKENTEAVRELLKRHGAQRLSDINPQEFGDVLKEAEVIPDA